MSLKFVELKIKGYDRVVHATNEITKLDCIIAIHNTRLGPSLGGVRSWVYNNLEDQKEDALRLSEAMTLKNSLCGIDFGGGKASLNIKGIIKTPDLYKSYAEAVELLKGSYLTAGDVGTCKEDLIQCSKVTQYVYGINVETSAPTSKGLFNSIKSTYNFINKKKDLTKAHIAISGVGKVGGKLAKLLFINGAKISASSINKELLYELKKEIDFTMVNPENLFQTNCDIVSPCALGKAINIKNRNQLKCAAIVGAANNQLDSTETAKWLFNNKIVYSPDYLVNSGGVIAIAAEISKRENLIDQHLNEISSRLESVLLESKENNIPTDFVAKRIALERINNS